MCVFGFVSVVSEIAGIALDAAYGTGSRPPCGLINLFQSVLLEVCALTVLLRGVILLFNVRVLSVVG